LNLLVQPSEPISAFPRGKTELKTLKFPDMTPKNLGKSNYNSSLEGTPSNTNRYNFGNYGENFTEKHN
jgi:hypothetical protein